MGSALLRKLRVVAARHESATGTAQTLTAADAAMNVFNPVFQPTVTMHDRESPTGFGTLAATVGQQYYTATFTTEVHGDGNGGVPFWASQLFPACGMVRDGNTFRLRTSPPVPGTGDSQARTLTLGSYENGRLKVLTGGMGNWKLSFENSKHATIEWTFMGRYTPVIDAPMLSGVIRPTEPPIPFVGKDILIDGRPTGCLNSMSIESGNNVIIRPCAAEVGGVESGLITGRKITANFDPEACLIAEDDVYQSWLGGDEHAFEICLENENDLITFAGPRFQRTNIQDAEREGIDIDQTTGQFNIENGDDEFSITFGSPPTPPAPTVT